MKKMLLVALLSFGTAAFADIAQTADVEKSCCNSCNTCSTCNNSCGCCQRVQPEVVKVEEVQAEVQAESKCACGGGSRPNTPHK